MLELIKDYVKLNQVVPVTPNRSVYEHDCIVPDSMPDAAKVLAADGTALVDKVTPGSDCVVVDFTIQYKILYMADSADASIQSMQTQSSHTVSLDAPGIGSGADWDVACCLEHVDHTLINSRKLSFRCVVKVSAKIENCAEKGIATGLEGLPDLQCNRECFTVSNKTETLTSSVEIQERVELPGGKASIFTLLRSDPRLCDSSMTLSGDQLQVRGTLSVCTLYLADDQTQSMQILENQIPFSQSIPLPTLDDGITWDLASCLKTFHVEVEEDGDGEKRILSVQATIVLTVKGYETKSYDILTDAYSLSKNFGLKKDTMAASRQVGEIATQFVLKEVVAKPEGTPSVSEIVNVTGQIGQADYEAADGTVSLDGFVVCNVLYLSNDENQPLASFTQQIPFTQTWEQREVTDGVEVSIKPEVSHTSFSILSAQEMELRIAVAIKGELTSVSRIPVITEVEEVSDDDKDLSDRPSILLYVVQPGDTLWKVAKRYSAPMDVLQQINELENPDLLLPGQKLLIPT